MVQSSRTVSPHQRSLLRSRARQMRHNATETEWLLWQALRRNQLGVTFRRQVVLRGYIADFYACAAGLVVEVDGTSHAGHTRVDARRDRALVRAGYRVLHVSAQAVKQSMPSVLAQILAAL